MKLVTSEQQCQVEVEKCSSLHKQLEELSAKLAARESLDQVVAVVACQALLGLFTYSYISLLFIIFRIDFLLPLMNYCSYLDQVTSRKLKEKEDNEHVLKEELLKLKMVGAMC